MSLSLVFTVVSESSGCRLPTLAREPHICTVTVLLPSLL